MKNKYFWKKKWFWIGCASLIAVGFATLSNVTNHNKALINYHNLDKTNFADNTSTPDTDTLSGYGYHALTTVNYVPWTDSSEKKIVDIFPTVSIASKVLNALENSNSTKFASATSTINSTFAKDDLKKIQSLDLSNLNLTNIDEILNPVLSWDNLVRINLSNNNFNDYVLKFQKTQMPKLYWIIARNANLNEMVDVSSYVTDPFDQAASGSEMHTTAEKEYAKALNKNVPRYFDLFQNNIPQIPKYYLKIALASFNLGSNKLGSGTVADPQGIYAIPWYSMKSTESDTIGIADPNIRGPYGINVYSTGEKKANGSYLYSDEEVARWRAQPYPIKSLRFDQYNLTPDASGNLDTNINFPASDDSPGTGGTKPDFNFGNNQLVNIPIFQQANVEYNEKSSTLTPQNKSAVVFVGLDDFKKSKVYNDSTNKAKTEMITPQPDSIYPIIANWSWANSMQNDGWFDQAMQGLYYSRSFNGIKQFEITQDSRTVNNQWDDSVATAPTEGSQAYTWNVPANLSNWNNLLTTNLFGSQLGDLTFNSDQSSSANYYKKWLSLRTFILSSKTFWKKTYKDKWTNAKDTIDANLYWDVNTDDSERATTWRSPWSGARNQETTYPNGTSGKTWFFRSQIGHETNFRKKGPERQFSGLGVYYPEVRYRRPVPNVWIVGLSQPAYFSNINNNSDYGVAKDTPTPFNQGLAITAPGYDYSTSYQVVDSINSNLDQKTNFATSLSDTGFNLAKYKNNNKPVFARNITASDIANGENVFWKSESQFDQAYMQTLQPNKIKISYDDAAGTLSYSFWVYSPGYSDLGRLFKNGDGATKSSNNDTKTIAFKVEKTISGFAKANLKMKAATGNDFVDVNSQTATNNVLVQKAPQQFLQTATTNPITGNLNDTNLKAAIAKEFQTSYLGNLSNAEDNQAGVETALNSQYVDVTNINNSNGTISFKIQIPDYVFDNKNRLAYPEKLKNLVFTWTGIPVPTLKIIGNNFSQTTALGLSFSSFNKNTLSTIQNKNASQITIQDIVNVNAITGTRRDWLAIKTDPTKFNNYFELNPDDANGTLIWSLKLPGDTSTQPNGLLPLTVVVEWTGLANQNTQITWKTNLSSFITNKTPSQVLEDIKANPNNYLDIQNGRENNGATPFTTNDFDFSQMTTASVINNENGTVQVNGISLKNYYKNGLWINNSAKAASDASTNYLLAPVHFLQAQKPYYVANFATDSESDGQTKIWESIIKYSTETDLDQVKGLSASEIKQLLVNNNISPLKNVLSLTTIPKTTFKIPENSLVYKNNELSQSITSNPLTGTLTFQNLSVQNWVNQTPNTVEKSHPLNSKTYNFKKLSNTWEWASKLPLEVSSLSFNAIQAELSNSTSANTLINYFNVGQKYYDDNGVLKNTYTINPSLVTLDPYLGTLTFKANAITVSNWVTNGNVSQTSHSISQAKVYNFENKLETQYHGNTNLVKGVNAFINEWVKVTKDDSFNNASDAQKMQYLREFNQIKSPNYTGIDVETGIDLTNKYLTEHNLKQIKSNDKTVIDNLKNKTSQYQAIDFNNYFYVPQYLLFLASPVNDNTSSNRTFAIAEKVETTSFSKTAMQLSNVYLINYYKNGEQTIKKIPNILFPDFLNAVSSVVFKANATNPSVNALADGWKNLGATQIKERLDYLTNNRNNLNINGTPYYKQIQKEWMSTFTSKNIPYSDISNVVVVYPIDVVASDYERVVIVKQLLFPYYSQVVTAQEPDAIAVNKIVDNKQVWNAQFGFNSSIQDITNLNTPAFNKIPAAFLKDLGLKEGTQEDGATTWNTLVTKGLYRLNGSEGPISTNGLINNKPVISVGKISLDNQKGTITFESITGKNVWVDGQQVNSQNFADLTLNLGLQNTHLVKNSNAVIEAWLNKTLTTNSNSISEKLIVFNQKIISGAFNLDQFNAMLNDQSAFFAISDPGNTLNTKIQVIPNTKVTEAFHLDLETGEITFKNLQILNGYLNNAIVPSQNLNTNFTFNLGWDYSTNFNQKFESLLLQKQLLNSNTDHAANVLNNTNPAQLISYLGIQELSGQLETPNIVISSNPVLGKLTFNVHFKNYYQNGVNVGSRNFSYSFHEFQKTLPAILGGIGASLGAIIVILIAWYIYKRIKNQDKLMIKTNKKSRFKN